MSAAATGRTPYRVKAESIEACNCQHGCNCQFAGVPNEGKCEFIIGYAVTDVPAPEFPTRSRSPVDAVTP